MNAYTLINKNNLNAVELIALDTAISDTCKTRKCTRQQAINYLQRTTKQD